MPPVLGCQAALLQAQTPAPGFDRPFKIIDSIPAPESIAIGPDGAWYVSSFDGTGETTENPSQRGAVWRVAHT